LLARFDLGLESGDLAEAAAAAQRLQALASSQPLSRVQVMSVQARLAAAQGRYDEARGQHAAARQLLEQRMPESARLRRTLALAAAETELAAARPTLAREHLQALPPALESAVDATLWRAADLRAEADLQEGLIAEALAWYRSPLSRLQAAQNMQRSPRDEASVRIHFGSALRKSGQEDLARVQFARAAELIASQHADSPVRALLAAARGD
jgi:hypothetical protein